MIKKLILLSVATAVLSGCAGFSREAQVYGKSGLYDSSYDNSYGEHKGAVKGFSLLEDSGPSDLVLKAPHGIGGPDLKVKHYFKVWYDQGKEILAVQNLYLQEKDLETGGKDYVYIGGLASVLPSQGTVYNVIGQSILLLDLKGYAGFAFYNGHHSIKKDVRQGGYVKALAGDTHIYGTLSSFLGVDNFGAIAWREKTPYQSYKSLSPDFSKNFKELENVFVFGPSNLEAPQKDKLMWYEFGQALLKNDKAALAKLGGVKGFLVDTMQVHLPGVHADSRPSNSVQSKKSVGAYIDPATVYRLGLSEDESRFIKGTNALSPSQLKALKDRRYVTVGYYEAIKDPEYSAAIQRGQFPEAGRVYKRNEQAGPHSFKFDPYDDLRLYSRINELIFLRNKF